MNRDRTARQLTLFAALVAFGVLGRWLQPAWNFTPVAAVAGFSAFYFGSAAIALLATFAVLAISNLILPDYQSTGMMLAVFAAYVVPVLLGRGLNRRFSWSRLAALGVVPPVAFYLATNFAHWALLSQYPHTWAGLLECYAAAVPFFRDGTLAGDVFYTAALFGTYALATRGADAHRPIHVAHVGCSMCTSDGPQQR